METLLLDAIQSPADLKKLDFGELERLCNEIRNFLISSVSKTGGHLSSNLGVIELTIALHRIFNSPQDMFVFDVGHQCYTHKLLTGRRAEFASLRKAGGLSGFPSSAESVHDVFLTGHGSTSISAAVGLAHAKKLKNEPGLVFAIIGDGAFTGGMIYEGLNNIDHLDNLVLLLNDNKMSISKNTGALAHYFTSLRTSPQYYKAKTDVKFALDKTPLVGQSIKKGIQTLKTSLRRSVYHSTFFEEMGFQYIGPVDGHNLPALCHLFLSLKNIDKPLFIHLETTKGKGFKPAENNPGAFHGVSSFDANHITDPDITPG
ncbi:MAG: 1-deoxy-D-xylulose-5-phosphate synthase N-terminal domain-containing protein, partial [Oscillospiraceae bacterium]